MPHRLGILLFLLVMLGAFCYVYFAVLQYINIAPVMPKRYVISKPLTSCRHVYCLSLVNMAEMVSMPV